MRGRERRRERERRRACGGSGRLRCEQSLGLQGDGGDKWEAKGQPELAPRSPWGQTGGEEAMLGYPCLICGHQRPPPTRCVCRMSPKCHHHRSRKILRLTPERGRGNKRLGKILHTFAYKSQCKSNSQKPRPGLHHGLSVLFAPWWQHPRLGLASTASGLV